MKRSCSAACLALAVVALVGFSGPVRAGDQVPFTGGLSGLVSHTPVDDQTDYVVVEATGTATHLGQFAVSAPHFVDLPTRTAAGYYEFTAANGDKVYGEFTGQATPTSTPGVISIVESVTITGGTGRFAGASGSFTVERLYDRIAGTTIGSFKGSISTP
jgi:hypothetical protein